MARYRKYIDANLLEKMLKEGRGQGRGKDYKPFLEVSDLPSEGLSSRIWGLKTGRITHCFSLNEAWPFYIFEWSDLVIDIREQFPLLPLSDTLAIAEQCHLKHPTHPHTQKAVVMTTDFVVTIKQGNTTVDVARTVKLSAELNSPRTQVKLELERLYWQKQKIDWDIITERDTPVDLAKNIKLLRGYRSISDRVSVSEADIQDITHKLEDLLAQGTLSLAAATAACDRELGYERGTSLTVAYHLLALKRWQIDLFQLLAPEKPFRLLAGVPV